MTTPQDLPVEDRLAVIEHKLDHALAVLDRLEALALAGERAFTTVQAAAPAVVAHFPAFLRRPVLAALQEAQTALDRGGD